MRTSPAVPTADLERRLPLPLGRDLDRTLRLLPFGPHDPTRRWGPGRFWCAAHTPAGPATLAAAVEEDVRLLGWGPGGAWALDRAPALLGLEDRPQEFAPPAGSPGWLRGAVRVGLPRTPWVLDALSRFVLQQRVAFRDAARSHRLLVARLGRAAPGPPGLLLPLGPGDWMALSGEDLRRAGVDVQRGRTLRLGAREARSLEAAEATEARRERIARIPGCGPWTVEMTLGFGLGDPDAVPPGDLHLPALVGRALAGDEAADDARMLELLEPYRGHRFRVVRAVCERAWTRRSP